jgi:hypothetical protein
MDGVMVQVGLRSPDPTIEDSAAVALCALADWRWAVRGSPSESLSDHARTALLGLVAWYERICVDDQYDSPAPVEGLAVLTARERAPNSVLTHRVVVTYWAVRVAQELAEFRRRRITFEDDPAAVLLAHTKLDLAVRGALDWMR